jgi:hypothetical protein
MDLREAFRIWRRRRILTAALLAAALAGAAAAVMGLPRVYQSNSSVVLLASSSSARLNGGNPYLSFSPSLTLTADAVSRELMAPGTVQSLVASGFTASYTVALAPFTTSTTGSVLLVTVSGRGKTAVEGTLTGVTREIGAKLAQLQRKLAPGNRIRAVTLSFAPEATLSISQTARSLVIVIAPGLALALAIPVMVDGQITRRRIRAGAAPRDPGPAGRGLEADSAHAAPGQPGRPGGRSPVRSGGQSGQ